MSIEFKISSHYLRAKRQKGFLSFISSASTLGLALGVMALITVLSVMNGFHQELKGRILSAISHGYISEYDNQIANYAELNQRILAQPGIVATSPYIDEYALISANGASQGIGVRGVDIASEHQTSSLLDNIARGSSQITDAQVLIGQGLAQQLGLDIGDKILLLTPKTHTSILGVQPRFKRFSVGGIFDAGMNEYNNSLAFITLTQAQKLYQMPNLVSGIRVKTEDIFAAKRIISETVNQLDGKRYYGVDWMQQKANFIQALNLEKQMIGVILSLIIAVAAFNIVSMMIMVVTDKRAEIAILRTLGMTPKRIVRVFFYQALSIGLIGIVLGVVLGILLSLNIEAIIAGIEGLFGFEFFPQDVFYINRFPSQIQVSDVLGVALGAFVLVLLAAIYPAKRAGKVSIAKVLNHE